MKKKLLRFLVVIVVTVAVFKSSTYGWLFLPSSLGPGNIDTTAVERLKNHVMMLSQNIGSRGVWDHAGLERSAEYITQQLRSCGYTPEFQTYTVHGKQVKNIIAEKKGTKTPEEIVVVGAHYDTYFNPGADDNASGVAGLLELAKALSGRDTARTLRFVAFVNEEPPFFQTEEMGSLVYARQASARHEDIKAAVILEMIGYFTSKPFSQRYPPFLGYFYPNSGNSIAIIGNQRSARLVHTISKVMKAASPLDVRSFTLEFVNTTAFSDNWSFWRAGYQAVMVTDTAFYRNKNYHTQRDTHESLDYSAMAHVVSGLKKTLLTLTQ